MEEYKEVVRFEDDKRIVVAHMYPTGKMVHLENIVDTFKHLFPPHKGRVRCSTSISLINGTYYMLGITFYFKDKKIFVKCMSDEDREEITTDFYNRSTRRLAEREGYKVEFEREADLSKLSFLNRCQPEMS